MYAVTQKMNVFCVVIKKRDNRSRSETAFHDSGNLQCSIPGPWLQSVNKCLSYGNFFLQFAPRSCIIDVTSPADIGEPLKFHWF